MQTAVQNSRVEEPGSKASAGPPAISLELDWAVPAKVRARMEYAFRVFAAIYGHAVVGPGGTSRAVRFRYAANAEAGGDPESISIPTRYRVHGADEPAYGSAPPSFVNVAGEAIPLFLGTDPISGNPDWLGEIFLWLSGELELGAKKRDTVGRIPFSETPFAKFGISAERPYAGLVMAWLENALLGNGVSALPRAPSPVANCEHIVLPSHDIDYYYSGTGSAFVRLAKNLAIAVRLYKNGSYFADNLRALLGVFSGKRPGDYLVPLLDAAQASGFESTFFVVSRRSHPRDPNYSLETIASPIAKAIARGFSPGLHGSYRSVMEDRSLAGEASILSERFAKRIRTNRQHWLRFATHRSLFRELEAAGMFADSSLGFPESAGFRNGASFAFPPYDFERECAHRFLEIPLVLMDGGVEAEARQSGRDPGKIADAVLDASRKTGWGGISILWHNPIEPLSVPREINEIFWRLAAQRKDSKEEWLTFDRFLAAVLPRYQQAGLMEGIRVNA